MNRKTRIALLALTLVSTLAVAAVGSVSYVVDDSSAEGMAGLTGELVLSGMTGRPCPAIINDF
jgi:hypothetical protein